MISNTDEEANKSHCWRVINHKEIYIFGDDYAFENTERETDYDLSH